MDRIKTIALYLPQFHRTPENDEWWGDGFTEWTAVRNAKPINSEHNQPREPLNDNYYNLLEKSTMEWQTKLAKEYCIEGFCFYHYWFENGKKILEKPAENLLQWKDIDMPFCFAWANESWMRTWGNVRGGNVWSELYGDDKPIGNGILLNQSYGDENAWKEHFEYLLPFFEDRRYITVGGKPVFIIYRPDLIPSYCLNAMFSYFKHMALEAGLPGLHLIAVGTMTKGENIFDAFLSHEPKESLSVLREKNMKENKGYQYDELWKIILNKSYEGSRNYLCAVVDYDETPRKGKRGRYLEGSSPAKFYNYFKKLLELSMLAGNEFVFINAWNEWGEGMYLEPDKKNGYEYLAAVKTAIQEMKDISVEAVEKYKDNMDLNEKLNQKDKRLNKFINYFDVMNAWLTIKQAGESLETYFLKKGYKTIALYGIGVMGKHLFEELKYSDINIAYAIDRNVSNSFIQVYSVNDSYPEVDAVIVTPTFDFGEIDEKLKHQVSCPIVSLEEVVISTLDDIV